MFQIVSKCLRLSSSGCERHIIYWTDGDMYADGPAEKSTSVLAEIINVFVKVLSL